MIERDVVLRQVHQLAPALAVVVGRRGEGDGLEAQEALADVLARVLDLPLAELRAMGRAQIEALAAEDGRAVPEKAVALADLLREDAEMAGRVRARWLYQFAVEAGGPVPFDVHERIAALPEAA